MKAIYVEFPETYREINSIVEKFTQQDYYSVCDTVDKYVELLVWMECNRRWYNADVGSLKSWLRLELANYPLIDDYFSNNVVQKYIVHSTTLWGAVRSELTFTPTSKYLLWHIERGLWKMLATGVTPYVE